ncbi:hypothetical protein AK830_g2797 [Neonectria ditissima]|uniref:Uncharacterized protein n=1 Tax=Neonectria ditissima TaxID=78410 RepID=A0A0P7BRC6_9HYPO|nr:hypothetical protein AK830_g2797 [Neonectria ditissima]
MFPLKNISIGAFLLTAIQGPLQSLVADASASVPTIGDPFNAKHEHLIAINEELRRISRPRGLDPRVDTSKGAYIGDLCAHVDSFEEVWTRLLEVEGQPRLIEWAAEIDALYFQNVCNELKSAITTTLGEYQHVSADKPPNKSLLKLMLTGNLAHVIEKPANDLAVLRARSFIVSAQDRSETVQTKHDVSDDERNCFAHQMLLFKETYDQIAEPNTFELLGNVIKLMGIFLDLLKEVHEEEDDRAPE